MKEMGGGDGEGWQRRSGGRGEITECERSQNLGLGKPRAYFKDLTRWQIENEKASALNN